MPQEPILKVQDLRTDVVGRRGVGHAVDGVDFTLRAG